MMEVNFMMQSSLLTARADAFVPALAPLVALAFLGAGFVFVVAVVSAGVAFAARRVRLARWLGGAGLAVAAAYAVLLFSASAFPATGPWLPASGSTFARRIATSPTR